MLKLVYEEYLFWVFRIVVFFRSVFEFWFLFFMFFNIGAFFSMLGKIRKRILLSRMYICFSCVIRLFLYVIVMLDIWKGVIILLVRVSSISGE